VWIVRVALDRPYTSIEGRAERVPVKLGRDDGRSVEVVTGLQPTDAVILDPADSLVSGTAVRVRAPEHPKAGAPKTGG
jgi:multidrug efflux pump subunit AcrA (membrane-fusion protein)